MMERVLYDEIICKGAVDVKQHIGRQVLGELALCNQEILDNPQLLEEMLRDAAKASGATLLSVHTHRFEPHGVSAVAILAESHLAVHTWPELGYAAVDAFTCGDHVDPARAVDLLEQGLQSQHSTTVEMSRGVSAHPNHGNLPTQPAHL